VKRPAGTARKGDKIFHGQGGMRPSGSTSPITQKPLKKAYAPLARGQGKTIGKEGDEGSR